MGEKIIILCVGLPRSGKTTWAKLQGLPIVCPDQIRFALHGHRFIPLSEPFVWAIAYTIARALLLSGHDMIIIDATNTTQKRRKVWIDNFKDFARIEYKIFDTSKEECIKRAEILNDMEIIPIIEKMALEYEPVNP